MMVLNLLPDMLPLPDRMKRILIILSLIILLLPFTLEGQQSPVYTQYMFNKFVYNPAFAGVDPFFQIRSNHRFQWVGLTDPPLTNSLSYYGPHATLPMGYGGYIYYDVTGPTSRAGLTGAYAYNVGITDDLRLSMGISLGIMQYKMDGTQITLKDPTDDALEKAVYSSFAFDANFGLYLYSDNYYAGFSTTQLINSKLKLYGLNKLKTHYYLTGGYTFDINDDFKLEPSMIIKATSPLIFQLDFNVRVIYMDMIWLGLSYRTQDALSFLIGYTYNDRIHIGYSYDFTTTDLRKYNSGTHEIMIGYRFHDIKK
jgi:type IX secretion system PorP/SprF family membrane protein